jgi:hypothetical protein
VTDRQSAAELLATPGALIDRPTLAAVGMSRTWIDYVFAHLDVRAIPGIRRTYVVSDDVRRLLDEHTYGKDEVRPS